MNQEPKRIVSKREYAVQIFKKTGWSVASFVATLITMFLFLAAMMIVIDFARWRVDSDGKLILAGVIILSGIACACATTMFRKAAINTKLDLPLTRANTGNLPAPNSLVRASQEPLQSQETILLRAAIETQEVHEEELLRASGGQK